MAARRRRRRRSLRRAVRRARVRVVRLPGRVRTRVVRVFRRGRSRGAGGVLPTSGSIASRAVGLVKAVVPVVLGAGLGATATRFLPARIQASPVGTGVAMGAGALAVASMARKIGRVGIPLVTPKVVGLLALGVGADAAMRASAGVRTSGRFALPGVPTGNRGLLAGTPPGRGMTPVRHSAVAHLQD